MDMKKVISKTECIINEFEKREQKEWTPEIMITELKLAEKCFEENPR